MVAPVCRVAAEGPIFKERDRNDIEHEAEAGRSGPGLFHGCPGDHGTVKDDAAALFAQRLAGEHGKERAVHATGERHQERAMVTEVPENGLSLVRRIHVRITTVKNERVVNGSFPAALSGHRQTAAGAFIISPELAADRAGAIRKVEIPAVFQVPCQQLNGRFDVVGKFYPVPAFS
jgi:hypothetical protein